MSEDPIQERKTADSPTIKVCVRVRPFIREELEGERGEAGPPELCVAMPTETRVEISSHDGTRGFDFDRCYWSFSKDHQLYATQETLQQEIGETMLEHAMNGFNNCIFAYGQTGSGKSFSVLGGTGEARGLLPRVVEGLFSHIARATAEGATCKTWVSFMEIYNENIQDLLVPRDAQGTVVQDSHAPHLFHHHKTKLEVKQHPVLGTVIPGLTESAVRDSQEVLDLVDFGMAMRRVSSTAMNATSSRSHCIFTFKTSVSMGSAPMKMSQTHLVDLAGSERSKRTKATGDRLKEGASINQSLSTLARVISALASKKKSNPPFRDSRLTYILKESLCGNSKTVMMAAISPSLADYAETLSTLKFAKSVKQVQTHAVCNQVCEQSLEKQLRAELERLREQLTQLQAAKSNDARRLSVATRQLTEQEVLVSRFGMDWETLLAIEKRRNQTRQEVIRKRICIDPADLAALQAQFAHLMSPSSSSASSRSRSESRSDSESSGPSGASSPMASPRGRGTDIVLVEGSKEAGSSLLGGYLAIRGASVRGTQARHTLVQEEVARDLGRSLRKLQKETEEAEQAVAALAGPGAATVQIRAMVCVDTITSKASLAVCASYKDATGETPASAPSRQRPGPLGVPQPEWLTVQQFQTRLEWLRNTLESQALAPGQAASGWPGGPWHASAGLQPVVRTSSKRSACSTPSADTEALRAELAAAKAELVSVKQRLAAVQTQPLQLPAAAPEGAGPGVLRGRRLAASFAAGFAEALGALDAVQALIEGTSPECWSRRCTPRLPREGDIRAAGTAAIPAAIRG